MLQLSSLQCDTYWQELFLQTIHVILCKVDLHWPPGKASELILEQQIKIINQSTAQEGFFEIKRITEDSSWYPLTLHELDILYT